MVEGYWEEIVGSPRTEGGIMAAIHITTSDALAVAHGLVDDIYHTTDQWREGDPTSINAKMHKAYVKFGRAVEKACADLRADTLP